MDFGFLEIMETWSSDAFEMTYRSHLWDTRHIWVNKWAASWQNQQVVVRPAKTQISLGIRLVWSESSLSAWRKLGSLATHWAHSKDSDQTGRMPRLIWVFAGRTVILLVLLKFCCCLIHVFYMCAWKFQTQKKLHLNTKDVKRQDTIWGKWKLS